MQQAEMTTGSCSADTVAESASNRTTSASAVQCAQVVLKVMHMHMWFSEGLQCCNAPQVLPYQH